MPPGRNFPLRRVAAALLGLALAAAACSDSATTRQGPSATSPATTAVPPTTAVPGTGQAPGTTGVPPTVRPIPATPGSGYAWQAGDCFDFGRDDDINLLPYAPYGEENRVPCDGPHTHDVFHAEGLSEGSEAPFPEDLGSRVDAACSARFRDAYGLVWPDSTLSVIRYLPDEQEWAAGERYLACVVYRASPGGLVERRTGPAGGPDTTWPADEGACFTGDLRSVRQPEAVDCAGEHTFEVVGVGEHPAAAGDAFPSQSQLDGFMDQFCIDALAGYLDGPPGRVSVIPIRFGAAEWELGYRTIRCLAFATEGGELALVAGSFRGDWTLIGPVGGDTVTA